METKKVNHFTILLDGKIIGALCPWHKINSLRKDGGYEVGGPSEIPCFMCEQDHQDFLEAGGLFP